MKKTMFTPAGGVNLFRYVSHVAIWYFCHRLTQACNYTDKKNNNSFPVEIATKASISKGPEESTTTNRLLCPLSFTVLSDTHQGKLCSGAKLICSLIRAHQRRLCELVAEAWEELRALKRSQPPAYYVPLTVLHFTKQNKVMNRSIRAFNVLFCFVF